MKQEKYYIILNGMIVGSDGSLATLIKSFNEYIENSLKSMNIDLSGLSGQEGTFSPLNYQTAFSSIKKTGYYKKDLVLSGLVTAITIQKYAD